MNKIVFIIIISIIINLYTGFLVFLDYLAEYRTIEISNQSSYISKEIKEHFDIDYDIKKVKFYPGFPDGYYLDIYDLQNECHHEFEDKHEKSEIYDYFKNNDEACGYLRYDGLYEIDDKKIEKFLGTMYDLEYSDSTDTITRY